jgi:hypothetical protein
MQWICLLFPSIILENLFVSNFIVPKASLQKPVSHSMFPCKTLWQWIQAFFCDVFFEVFPMILFLGSELTWLGPDKSLIFSTWNGNEKVLLCWLIFFVFICNEIRVDGFHTVFLD